jgi:hypothetical protein
MKSFVLSDHWPSLPQAEFWRLRRPRNELLVSRLPRAVLPGGLGALQSARKELHGASCLISHFSVSALSSLTQETIPCYYSMRQFKGNDCTGFEESYQQ